MSARSSGSSIVSVAIACLLVLLAAGCGSNGAEGSGSGSGGALLLGGNSGANSGGGSQGADAASVPQDFVATDHGGYARGEAIDGSGLANTGVSTSSSDQGCDMLVGVSRDFKASNVPGGHPDFETFSGSGATKGLVASQLGSDGKPVYTGVCERGGANASCPSGAQTTTKANFDEWYRYTDGVNKPYLIYFQFVPNGDVFTFESYRFFPLDDAGWGDSGNDADGKPRNFHFTTELHTKFQYKGGERFTFLGDDDVWVFVNGRLAIDLGGLHVAVTETLDLDRSAATLGIAKGGTYALDLFHAERHTVDSNFRVDTNLVFVDCGSVPPDQNIN